MTGLWWTALGSAIIACAAFYLAGYRHGREAERWDWVTRTIELHAAVALFASRYGTVKAADVQEVLMGWMPE